MKTKRNRRTFYLIDHENNDKRFRITMRDIIAYFTGDGSGPVKWNRNNVDLDRYATECEEINYTFEIVYH